MRHCALTAAVVALTVCSSLAHAEDDFATLLKDLTFADAVAKSKPLAVAPEESTEDLRPVPTGLRMPVLLESSAMSLQGIPAIPESASSDPVTLRRPVAAGKPIASLRPEALHEEPVVAVPLRDPPMPSPAVASQLTGHRHHAVESHCQPVVVQTIPSRPRVRPSLPSSSLLQYFRSDPCYTQVWDGYHRSCKHHDHLHGTCDCFRDQYPCGEVLPCDRNGCVSCDADCDR